jgi:hypothetical protein
MTSPCPCGPPQDPQVISNPPGLSQISFRVDDFTGFRRALLRPLPSEQAIVTWRPAPGDLGLQVLEWWAYLGDVLTFYNERIANESYLRTATQASSLANLVALLGYQPAPGIAATGSVAAMRTAAQPNEPLVIPAGMQLSSAATSGVPVQTFEVGATASFTGVSSVPATLPPDTAFVTNSDGTPQSVLLAGQVSGVKPDDQLLLVEQGFAGADDNWSLVTVGSPPGQSVEPVTPQRDPASGAPNTLITFSAGGWGPTPVPAQDVDAPPQVGSVSQSTSYRLVRPTAAAALWNADSSPSGSGQQVVEPGSGVGLTVRLSATVRGISPGDMVLFDCGAGTASALAIVTGAAEELWVVGYPSSVSSPPTPPDIVVQHTALTIMLAVMDANALLDVTDYTTVAVRYAFKDVGTIIGVPQPTLPSLPATVDVSATNAPAQPQTAFLVDSTGAGVLVTATPAASGQLILAGAGNPPAVIGTPLAVPLQLLVDLVPVSRGTTVTGEVLGSGNAALINQSFTLSKSPLTYLASGSGWTAALAVYVNGVQWQEVPSFFGQAPDAPVFVVSRSADQTVTTLTFGDGVNGATLPSGTGNVVANYRYGSGAASPPAGRLTAITQPQPNLASIQNPVPVSGGTDPQAPDDVRTNAPASVFTFGRAISADDYEVVASQAAGVSRVTAYWTFDGEEQRTLVKLYVGDDQAAAAAAAAALAGAEDPNRPIKVVAATPVDLSLSATLAVSANYQADAVVAAARTAISDSAGGLFSPAQMSIGQRLYRSAIEAALCVPGVVAVHNLTVTGAGGAVLGDFFDPGEGEFFDLPPGNVSITGVSASA